LRIFFTHLVYAIILLLSFLKLVDNIKKSHENYSKNEYLHRSDLIVNGLAHGSGKDLNTVCMQRKKNYNNFYSTGTSAKRNVALFSSLIFCNTLWAVDLTARLELITEFGTKTWLTLSVLLIVFISLVVLVIWYIIKVYRLKIRYEEESKYNKEKELLVKQVAEKGKQYVELFDNIPIPMWVFDSNSLNFLAVNRAAINFYGYTREEFLSMNINDIMGVTKWLEPVPGSNLSGNDIVITNNLIHKRKDGGLISVEIISYRLPEKNGVHSRLVMSKDVTEKEKIEKELKESEKKYRQLIENAMVGILVSDIDGKILFANLKVCDMTNYTPGEFTSLNIIDTYIDEDYELAKYRLQIVWVNELLNIERKFKRKDGSSFYAEVSISKLDESRYQIFVKDISDRKKAEEELLKSNKQYQSFINDDLTGVFISTPSGRMLACNPSLLQILGFKSLQEIQDYDLYNLYPTRKDRNNLLRRLIESKTLKNLEIELCNKQGSRIFVLETLIGTFNSEDELTEIKGYIIDITAKKIVEIQLKKISQIVEQSPFSIIITDLNGMIEYANRHYLETHGFSLREIKGRSYSGLENGLQLTENSKTFLNLLNSDLDWRGELKYVNKDMVNWEFITTFTINLTGDTTHRAIIKENITDKKLGEEYLIKSETQLRTIWENTSDAMRLTNEEGIVLKVNEAYCRLFRKTRQELEGFPFYIIYEYYDENISDNIKNYYADRTRNDTIEFECILWDSAKVWVELENSFIEIENEPLLLLSIFRDITVRKDAELQLIAAKEKAEELNILRTNFLENISHEFRTPMIGILGFSQLLSVNLDDEDFRGMAGTIYLNGKRLLRTMDMVIDLSRIQSNKLELELKELNICEVVVNELKIFENEAQNKGLYLKLVMNEGNIFARLDERLFLQIFDNLLSNAIKFTYKGGVTVEVYTENSVNKLFPVIKVSDTGIGIEKAFIDLIFHDFRQASEGFKRRFEGVGLGLSISKKFAEIMNGTLTVESVFGEGSVFILKFPHSEKLNSISEKERGQAVESKNLEKNKILLVDDDENTYEIIKLTLKNICHVDFAETGEKALLLVNKKKYDIILMDIILGYGMNGIETTKEIRKIKKYAKIPIVALTAYAMDEDKVKFIEEGLTHYLAKPFELNQFRQFISKLLDTNK